MNQHPPSVALDRYDIAASRGPTHLQSPAMSSNGDSYRRPPEGQYPRSPAMSPKAEPYRRPQEAHYQRAVQVPTRTSSRNGRRAQSQPSEAGVSTASSRRRSFASSDESHETQATSLLLNPLQITGPSDELEEFEPLSEDDPKSFDLIPPPKDDRPTFSLEQRSLQLFSREHLLVIFSDPSLLLRFTAFLSSNRPRSIPMLVYYLDALKALKAIAYANAVAEALGPINGHEFTEARAGSTANLVLETKAEKAFEVLTNEDLPAYIAYRYTQIVSLSITQRITGQLAPHLREASEGLAEVFCLTDPSRPDNPIVFASEEFHRTTQYGMTYALGRNCRFLQGPKTSPHSVRRLREASTAGKEHCEVFLNYRRDGSPFMNLLMTAPLCDSRGKIRYFIGAQVDVSGLVKDCTDLESLQRLVVLRQRRGSEGSRSDEDKKDEFQELSEMLNTGELDTVKRWGGRMHKEHIEEENGAFGASHRPRILLKDSSPKEEITPNFVGRVGGKLSGVYQQYLLVRPYPSLRILFSSPSLRVPGILQSPFMDRIGGSPRVQEELVAALAEGRGVTAKVRWVTKGDEEGRNRWIHCTPLIGINGNIGVWMIVVVDDETSLHRRWKQAPPVAGLGNVVRPPVDRRYEVGGSQSGDRNGHHERVERKEGSVGSGSAYSLSLQA